MDVHSTNGQLVITDPEIKAATLRKLAAEAAKLEAEARAAEAEGAANARRLEEEAARLFAERLQIQTERRKLDIELANAEIDHKNKLREQAEKDAHNKYHGIYNFTDEVSESSVRECISWITARRRIGVVDGKVPSEIPLEIEFFSPGGSVISGLRLYDYLQECRRAGHQVITGTRGYAASMAGILLQAGDLRWAGKFSQILIHQISAGALGKVPEMEDTVKWLKKIQEQVIGIFAERAFAIPTAGPMVIDGDGDEGRPWKDIDEVRKFIRRHWERKDWWVSAEEAFRLGFVDEIR